MATGIHTSHVPIGNLLLFILLFLSTPALDSRFSTARSKGFARAVQYILFVAGM